MTFRRVRIAVCVLACSTISSAGAPMADRLPRGTLAYSGWAGRTDAMAKSTFGKLLRDPAAQALLERLRDTIARELGGENRRLFQRGWELGRIVLRRPFALAGLRTAQDQQLPFAACVLVDLGKDRGEFAKALDALLAAAGVGLKTKESVGPDGTRYRFLAGTGALPLATGYKGNMFFACMGGAPDRLLRVTPANSLAANPTFQARLKAVADRNLQAVYYADLGKIGALLARPAKSPAEGETAPVSYAQLLFAGAGLERIKSIAAATCITDDGSMRTRTRILSPRPHRGLLAVFAGGKLTKTDLAAIPTGASAFVAVKLSPKVILQEIRRVRRVMGIDPPGAAGERKPGAKLLGVKVAEELFPVLGDSATLFYAPNPRAGLFLLDLVVTISLKDPVAFGKLLSRMEADFERRTPAPDGLPRIKKRSTDQGEIRSVSLADRQVPQKLAWAVRGRRFYLARRPEALQAVIRLAEARPITADGAYQGVRKRLAAAPSVAIYGNTGHLMRTVIPVLLQGDAPPFEDSSTLLTQLLKLAGYFPPALTGILADREGITIETWSPSPPGLELAPLSTALLPLLGQARRHARVAVSRINLSDIGKAILVYRAEERGRFPPDFAALIRKGYMGVGALRSPVNLKQPPRFVGGRIVGPPHYVYVKGHTDASAPGLILAYETPETYEGRGTLALLVSGAVRWMTQDEFWKAMAATRKAIGKDG